MTSVKGDVSDVHAADAHYHADCKHQHFGDNALPGKNVQKTKQPADPARKFALKHVLQLLSEHLEFNRGL